ncbi:MAG: hypothetical protein ACI4AK_02600 [Lepagella sp.]
MRVDEKRWRGIVLMVAALLQLPVLFCGWEVCDSGFYLTFYDNIFSHPEGVSYNFMYYLSGVVGGVVTLLTGGGLFAMRLLGMAANLLSIYLLLQAARDVCSRAAQLCGVIMVCVGIWLSPLAFYNDTMTATLAMLSLALTLRGGSWGVTLGGMAAGVNVLTRLPNVMEVFFVLLLLFTRREKRRRDVLLWLGGWLVGVSAMIGLAAALGHLDLLGATITDLREMAGSQSSESTHSLTTLIGAQIGAWKEIGMVAVSLLIAHYMATRITRFSVILLPVKVVLWVVGSVLGVYILLHHDIVTDLAAISVAGCLLCWRRELRDVRIVAIAGLLMMVILPMGSDNGIYNAGSIVLWMAIVPAMEGLRRTAGRYVVVATMLIIIGMGGVKAWQGGFYFDDTPLEEMTATPGYRGTEYILTSAARAGRIRAITGAIAPYVSPGDTLLVYGSAPMLNHLTGTVPAMGCSWPELMTPKMLDKKLQQTGDSTKILVMRFNTIGSHWGAGKAAYGEGKTEENNTYHNAEKSGIIQQWIVKKRYKEIISTIDFALYIAESGERRAESGVWRAECGERSVESGENDNQ